MFMFDVKQAASAALSFCAVCEHRHPQGCGHCELPTGSDPWWQDEDAIPHEKVNIASGEDAHAYAC
jgi:hypothetical protein